MTDFNQKALDKHKANHGVLSISLKDQVDTADSLSIYYTPGVGAVSNYLATHKSETKEYTWTGNLIAVISDGSAVLGLGNIGPQAALPVMEGKSMLFKHFAGIDAVPIVLDVHTAEEIVNTVIAIAPSFGGINLEDIAAPVCFEVESRLKALLPIPVMHDDQHGTAIVTLAGLINAMKITHKKLNDCKIVIVGSGAAGVAITKLIHLYADKADLVVVDSKGILDKARTDLNTSKQELLSISNPHDSHGSLETALKDADVFIGVSQPKLLTERMIERMNHKPIIMAMANPIPEIMPDEAYKAGAAIVATGRSDFPNQINNALAFPGVFRGALDHRVRDITDLHKIKAAEVIAALVDNPSPQQIIPSIHHPKLVEAVANVIR